MPLKFILMNSINPINKSRFRTIDMQGTRNWPEYIRSLPDGLGKSLRHGKLMYTIHSAQDCLDTIALLISEAIGVLVLSEGRG